MKQLRKNMTVLLILFAVMFTGLAAYMVFGIETYSSRWIASPYNPRLRDENITSIPGDILDRNGTVLATSKDGARVYSSNTAQRKALSHVVGDRFGYCITGAESFHAATLLGYRTSVLDRVVQLVKNQKAQGNTLTLTVDAKLQTEAASLLGNKRGSIVVINYKTGEILCMASTPNFDPVKVEKAAADTSDKALLLNRATQGQYPPGSIFKIITCAAALENKDMSLWEHECTGSLEIDGRTVTCSKAHGKVNLKEAFTVSCNTAFAKLGLELGPTVMSKTASNMGFNREWMFDDLMLYRSEYDVSFLSKEDELAWSAVGQGKDLVTPLHMAMITGAVANDGVMMRPMLVLRVSREIELLQTDHTPRVDSRIMPSPVSGQLKEFMLSVVTSGTGTKAAIKDVKVAGKTGTAEVGGDEVSHAWFVGFIDDPEHPLAVAVVVENGGTGGSRSAPLASKILKMALDSGY